jgi:UDP-N-acetylmuramate dehydrogenase
MDYNGNIKILAQKKARFGYRSSGLGKYIIVSASFRLRKSTKGRICANISRRLRQRWASQDLRLPSAGCVFRNPPESPAARLIELAGFKGRSVGDAAVSVRHANFIVNRRKATFGDVLKLMREVKSAVKRKFQVELEPEIRIWRN